MRRTADGFTLGIPSHLRVEWSNPDTPRPVFTDLRAILRTNEGIDLGVAECHSSYEGMQGGGDFRPDLVWRGPAHVLEYFEKVRAGRPPTMSLTCYGEGYLLYPTQGNRVWVRGPSSRILETGTVMYPQDEWVEMIRHTGIVAPVLIEVPLPGSRPDEWAGIWKAVGEARDCLLRGGETGWKGAVTSARHALEQWQKCEPVDANAIQAKPRDDRTKVDRQSMLRHWLLQLAHKGPHSHSDEWTRADAVLLLACLSGLLAVRQP